jgi:RimJ/RimL family protein N-acetyltransferase
LDRHHLVTQHLRLVPITFTDADRLADFHADARVMSLLKHGALDRPQSDKLVKAYEAEWPALGFGSWIITERATGAFVGIGGLRVHEPVNGQHVGVALRAAFTPEAQGKGYGPELGRASVDFAFNVAGLDRVVAITRLTNVPGWKSLEKFGMRREREFDGDNGHRLVLYILEK